jgi:hypothetical protein
MYRADVLQWRHLLASKNPGHLPTPLEAHNAKEFRMGIRRLEEATRSPSAYTSSRPNNGGFAAAL